MIIGDIPRYNARRSPHGLAVADDRHRWTWTELAARVDRVALALRASMGLPEGARVASLIGNRTETVELLFACSRAGLVHTALDNTAAPAHVLEQVELAEPALLVVDRDHRDLAAVVASRGHVPVLDVDGDELGPSYATALERAPAVPMSAPAAAAPFSLAFTSGSSGRPKAVLHTSITKFARINGVILADRPSDSDTVAVVGPLHHQGPEYHLLTYAFVGAGAMLLPRFQVERLADAIARHRVTAFQAVPTMLKRFVDHAERSPLERQRLRLISYGSSRTDPDLVAHAHELLGCDFAQLGGGGTEGGPGLFMSQDDHRLAFAHTRHRHLLASCGRPTPGFDVDIVDDDLRSVATGEVGQLALRGPAFVREYWRDPEATARAWRGGRLLLGDVVRRDAEGYVYYLGRTDDRIKTGGKIVYASEVETALLRDQRIREAAVVGVTSVEWGEAVCAVVVATADGATPADLLREVRTRLPAHKVPKHLEVRAELPHTSSGKIAYAEIRAALATTVD